MKSSIRCTQACAVVILLLMFGAILANVARAQEVPPPGARPGAQEFMDGPPGAVQDERGNWRMQGEAETALPVAAAATGGPDDYGYVWNDSVPFNWIDATNGTDTGLSGESWNQRTGPIPLPFAFKYYDATYSSVYIGAAGYITFLDFPNWTWRDQMRTPRPSVPNTVISPFSTPLELATRGKNGRVFYQAGGSDPNRYFVITWNNVNAWDTDERYTFQVVLHENGDILFQYQTMTRGEDDWYWCGYVGIEDAEGLDGFGYESSACVPDSIQNGSIKAIRFTRPAPSARVKLTPRAQGGFTHAGASETYELTIYNNGELGADVYNVTISSPWPAEVRMNGQALADTNGDNVPDTGSLAQGARRQLTVLVQTPTFANIADTNTATLNVRSTRNLALLRSAVVRTSIPAPFAQVYEDFASPGARLAIFQPGGRLTRSVASPQSGIRSDVMAVVETQAGGYVVLWKDWINDAVYLRAVVVDGDGSLQSPVRTLSTMPTGWYNYLGAALAPDGNIGLSWLQEQARKVAGKWEYNLNVWFAILDPSGNFVLAPTNLTGNNVWAAWGAVHVPWFYHTQIVATDDNRFFVAWNDYRNNGSDWADNLDYAVRTSTGQVIKAKTRFSINQATDYDNADWPRLASLNGNRVLLTYLGDAGDLEGIRGAILNSAGDLLVGPIPLTDEWAYPQAAVQLSSGSILAIWQEWVPDRWGLRYALLNSTDLGFLVGPTDLVNPFSFTGDWAPSVAADANNRAVVTWGENDASYRPHHYYALLDGSGAVLTPPTPVLAARRPADGSTPYVASSFNGYGVAPGLADSPSSTTQSDVEVNAPAVSSGDPGADAQVVMKVGNRGLPTATNVVVTAELDPNLAFLNSSPPPSDSAQAATNAGGVYTWNVPDLRYLSQGLIVMNTSVPSTTIGARYPVTITISTTGSDVNPGNNSTVTEVMVAEQVYLPATSSSGD